MDTDIVRAAHESATAVQAALDAASALIVSYAFSFVGALVVLVVGVIAANVLERWTRSGLGRVRGLDPTVAGFLSAAVRYGVLVLVVVMVLAQFGVQTTSIIAALGAAGLAIGLALQGTLQNIAAGIMILVLRPFRVGESILAGTVSGTVKDIGLFTTELDSSDGLYVVAPNGQLWNTTIVNYSRNGTRRFDLEIGLGYGESLEEARQRLIDMAKADARVLAAPAPSVFVKSLGDTAVVVVLRVWCATADYSALAADLLQRAKEAFSKDGNPIAPA